MADHYILQGRQIVPCDMWTWARFFENREQCRIGYAVYRSCWVSTVFLGIDHRFGDGGPPVLFETLVFGGPFHEEMDRYCTYEEAEAGHLHYMELIEESERGVDWRRLKRYKNQQAMRDRKRHTRYARAVREATRKP